VPFPSSFRHDGRRSWTPERVLGQTLIKEAALESRRQFLKKAIYVAPLIITASVRPSFAGTGYDNGGGDDGSNNGGSGGEQPPPPVRLPPRYVGRPS